MEETRRKIAELEVTSARHREERLKAESIGCFSDKELAEKNERLQKLDHQITSLNVEKEKLKNKIRIKPLRG